MNELSTQVYTHVIITHAGGHYFITEQQNKKLAGIGLNDWFAVDGTLEGNKIKGSSIADVMTLAKYHETYPEKRPQLERKNFTQERLDEGRGSYPEGGYAMSLQIPGKPASYWMDSCIASFERQIEEAKLKGEPYAGKVGLLEKFKTTRAKRYG